MVSSVRIKDIAQWKTELMIVNQVQKYINFFITWSRTQLLVDYVCTHAHQYYE